MSVLPAWAAPHSQLVAEAVAANPEAIPVSSRWGFGQCEYRFDHPTVRKLRAIHKAAYRAAMDRWNAGEITRDEALDLVRVDADQLIEHLLRVGFAPEPMVTVQGDPLIELEQAA